MIILRDTREKNGWDFSNYDINVVDKKLHSGDYTIKGKEDIIIIERKASTGELSNNLVKDYARFCREFDRLPSDTRKIIICEFPQENISIFPLKSGIPFNKSKISPKFLRLRIYELTEKYNIEFIFTDNKYEAEQKAFEILREYET